MAKQPSKSGRKRREDRGLSEELEYELQQIIYNERPFRVGIKPEGPYFNSLYLWNRDAVTQLINSRLDRPLSTPCIAMYLERWGFPRMEHNQQPINRCTPEIKEWWKVHQSEIEKRAHAEKTAIYWICKRQMDCAPDEKFKGQRNNWMVSATNIRGKEHWLHIKGAYTEKHQLSFLKALASQSRQPVFLIRDVPDYYNSSSVMYWLCGIKGKIELFPPTLAKDHIKGIDSEEMTLLQFYEKRLAALAENTI
jgi:hypothetical protein